MPSKKQKTSKDQEQPTLFEKISEAASELKTDIVAGATAVTEAVAEKFTGVKGAIRKKISGKVKPVKKAVKKAEKKIVKAEKKVVKAAKKAVKTAKKAKPAARKVAKKVARVAKKATLPAKKAVSKVAKKSPARKAAPKKKGGRK